jgi:hypothetical protein
MIKNGQKDKVRSGGARIREQGKGLIWATFTDAEKELIMQASKQCGDRSMASFVYQTVMAEVRKILQKSLKND